MIEIDTKQLQAMGKRFEQAGKAVEKGSLEMMRLATTMVQGKAQELAPVDKTTLRKSIQKSYDAQTGKVGSNLEYAKYQEFGTGIYGPKGSPIFPKRARFLAWQGKDGKWIRARSVRGVKAKHFLKGGLDYMKQHIQQIKDLSAKMIIKSL